MEFPPTILGPQALGWAAALLTLLTFICIDMRRLRLLALAANATFIAYGTAAELLPVLVLHLCLVPVNLWRLNQAFNRREKRLPARAETSARVARKPSGWNVKRRGARVSRRRLAIAEPSQPPSGNPGRALVRQANKAAQIECLSTQTA